MTEFKYDIFLMYAQDDRPVVRELAKRLKHDGLNVWFDEWEIQSADQIETATRQGFLTSRALAFFMSKHAFGSEWPLFENATFQFRDNTNQERHLIPVRLDSTKIPTSIENFAFIDWQKESLEEYKRLHAAATRPPSVPAQIDDTGKEGVTCKVLEVLARQPSCISVSTDGKLAFVGSLNGKIRRWNLHSGKYIGEIGESSSPIDGLAINANGTLGISGRYDGALCIWDFNQGSLLAALALRAVYVRVTGITPDGNHAVSGSSDGAVCLWDLKKRQLVTKLVAHRLAVSGVAISDSGTRIVSGSLDCDLRFWDLTKSEASIRLVGHKAPITAVAVTADGKRAVSTAEDLTIRIWDLDTGKMVATMEGQTTAIRCLAVSRDGRTAVSSCGNTTISLWDIVNFKEVGLLEGHSANLVSLALFDNGNKVVSISKDGEVRLWTLPTTKLPKDISVNTTLYTNAKVLLVGESGVGKTGLAYRVTQDIFRESISTDAVWATQLKLPNTISKSGTEREIWLWDFAGQADYRLIHQLYMDETALAVLVFNPQSENPFDGLGQRV